jgi:hypothetical protein
MNSKHIPATTQIGKGEKALTVAFHPTTRSATIMKPGMLVSEPVEEIDAELGESPADLYDRACQKARELFDDQ